MRNPDMNNMGGTTILVRFPQGVNPDQKAADMLSFLKTFSWGYQHKLFREAFWMPLKDVCFSEIISLQLRQYNPVKVWIFLVAGILILLMAVFNYVSMCVAQVSYRAKEMATRRLLGSSARSIFWRLLGESPQMSSRVCSRSQAVGSTALANSKASRKAPVVNKADSPNKRQKMLRAEEPSNRRVAISLAR